MLQQIIHRILIRRHFWRHATFSEIAELYTSRLMTMFALRFVLGFVSVYLYRIGYSLEFIVLFLASYFLLKAIFAWPAAKIAAKHGPKHGLFYASVISAVGTGTLVFVEVYGITVLIVWGVLQAFAGSLNNLCHLVNFSKVKGVGHAGKELGYMNIIEKIASGLSPVIGGIVASLFGPAFAIVLSAVIFLFSAVPLFRTAEQTKLDQQLTISKFPWRATWRDFRAQAASGVDIFASGHAWILFITISVFAQDGSEIYAKIGFLSSLGLFIAFVSSYVYGQLIDKKQGLLLLKVSVVLNSFVHLLRPTITSILGVALLNSANDVATTGHTMAYTRGKFDTADRLGFRIIYLYISEVTGNLGSTLAAVFLWFLLVYIGGIGALAVFFVVASLVTLLIATPRFALYRK